MAPILAPLFGHARHACDLTACWKHAVGSRISNTRSLRPPTAAADPSPPPRLAVAAPRHHCPSSLTKLHSLAAIADLVAASPPRSAATVATQPYLGPTAATVARAVHHRVVHRRPPQRRVPPHRTLPRQPPRAANKPVAPLHGPLRRRPSRGPTPRGSWAAYRACGPAGMCPMPIFFIFFIKFIT